MKAWEYFLTFLEKKIGQESVHKWVRSLKIIRFDACNLYLEADDSFQETWIEEHVVPLAKKHLLNNNGHVIKIHLTSKSASPDREMEVIDHEHHLYESDLLTPHCSLEQYVPGPTNQMPFEIFCKLLGFDLKTGRYAPNQKEGFNPIFLYGPKGVGKTHLLMAAASFLQLQGLKVLYVKAETFTEHVVNAIRKGNMKRFRDTYRQIDALLIDDVEVFGRKGATQEELFHTFNTLHTSGKQMILTAHINPRLLEYIEERLISRFEWGITLPFEKIIDAELLLEILKKRASFYRLQFKRSLVDYLLKHFPSPSSITRAIEYIANHSSQGTKGAIELSSMEPLLKRLFTQEQESSLNPEKILSSVAEVFGIKIEDMLSKSQSRDSTLPRQIAMYLLRKELKLPYMKIGDIFHRDHSTVMSSIRQITDNIQKQNSDVVYYLNQLSSSFAKQ